MWGDGRTRRGAHWVFCLDMYYLSTLLFSEGFCFLPVFNRVDLLMLKPFPLCRLMFRDFGTMYSSDVIF